MRTLRNLSIARKLALSALATVLLLGALTWSVLAALSSQQMLQQRVASASAAERDGYRALVAMRQLRLAGRELQFMQTPAAVASSAARATVLHGAVAAQIAAMLATAAGAQETAPGQSPMAALDAFDTAVQRIAALRLAVLQQRDDDFMPSQGVFETAARALRSAVEDEPSLLPTEVDSKRQQIGAYHDAVMVSRDNAILFLATGQAGMQGQMANVDIILQSLGPALLDGMPTEALKHATQTMLQAGAGLRAAASDLFTRDEALRHEVTTVADPAAAALASRLDVMLADFASLAQRDRTRATQQASDLRRQSLVLAAGILVVLLVSAWLTARAVAGPIGAMTRIVQRMATGDTALAIGFASRRDEVGRMAAALEVLRAAVQQAHVQAQMIEQLPVGVMTCDPTDDFRITYLNAESRRLLSLVQAHLPVPVDTLVGVSIDRFHVGASRHRAMLASPDQLPHRATVRLGAETFELKVSALRRADGSYAGPMLNWHHLTRQMQLSDTFERSIAGIAHAVGRAALGMEQTAQAMSVSADGSGQRLEEVAGASQTATGNVQTVAANAEQLAGSVAEISRQVAESARIASLAVSEAEATDRSVAGLSEAATRIGDVVRLIGDIAGRTNLLALNATIEAARAGDAGRGFAVVANEVKVLANQTARATEEISSQIAAMQGATGHAITALRSIGGTITRMSEIATAIAAAVEQQGMATREIARSVQQAAAGTAKVDSNMGELTQAVRQTGGQAGDVVAAARALSVQAEALEHEVADFLAHLRAAA